jgi:uncharacterized protein
VFAKNDELISGISDFAAQQHIISARFTAIGALKQITVAWFDPGRKADRLNLIGRQVELVSLMGDIALYHDRPLVHMHCSVSFPDWATQASHLGYG